MLEAFGGELEVGSLVPLLEAAAEGLFTVALLERGGAVIAVEGNGFLGSRSEVLQLASARGRAASALRTADGETVLSLAEGGRVLLNDEVQQAPTDVDRISP